MKISAITLAVLCLAAVTAAAKCPGKCVKKKGCKDTISTQYSCKKNKVCCEKQITPPVDPACPEQCFVASGGCAGQSLCCDPCGTQTTDACSAAGGTCRTGCVGGMTPLNAPCSGTCQCCAPAPPPSAPSWSYLDENGVDEWPAIFPLCAGSSQSPIDIVTASATDAATEPFVFNRYDVVPSGMKISNNGHSAVVSWETDDISLLPSMSGGHLGAEYTFAQYHLHWGSVTTQGSEHTVNGVQFPMELHLVHFKTAYGSLGEAIKFDDGLAVLGIIYINDLLNIPNAGLVPVVDALGDIIQPKTESVVTPHSLASLLPGNTNDYYRYSGSLTTPTCNEVVTWTVFANGVKAAESQFEAFRGLIDSHNHPMVDNFRPVLPLNGRTVTHYS